MSHPNNEPALVRSTSDAEQVEHARIVESRARNHEDNDLRAVLATYAGRAVMARCLERCGVDLDPFAVDRTRTDYLVGRMSFGLELQREIKRVTLDNYFQMVKEAAQRAERRVDPKKKRRNTASGEARKPLLVETEDTVDRDEGTDGY